MIDPTSSDSKLVQAGGGTGAPRDILAKDAQQDSGTAPPTQEELEQGIYKMWEQMGITVLMQLFPEARRMQQRAETFNKEMLED